MKTLDKFKIINNPHRLNNSSCVKDSVSIVNPVNIDQNEILKKVSDVEINKPEIIVPIIKVL